MLESYYDSGMTSLFSRRFFVSGTLLYLAISLFFVPALLLAQSSATLSHRMISQEGIGVTISINPEPGWHVYWRYPGDSGARLKTNWACDGVAPGEKSAGTPKIEPDAWPIPEVIKVGPLANYGYGSTTNLPFTLPCDRLSTKRITAELEWLACKEECIPQYATLELMAPWNMPSESSRAAEAEHLNHFPKITEITLTGKVSPPTFYAGDNSTALIYLAPLKSEGEVLQARFIPDSIGQIENAAPQQEKNGELLIQLASRELKTLSGLLVLSPTVAFPVKINLELSASPINPQSVSLSLLGAAFLGGVILNIMPCVFPVLGLKIYQLVSATSRQRKVGSLLYALGICISMLILGGGIGLLRASGVGIGWGTQLQNPIVVYSLALLFVLLGANLLGVFEFGSSIQSAAGRVKVTGPLMDGLLTVLVATPCTAPFMAGAIAVAFTLPLLNQLMVFLALGLGIATPVLLIGLVPGFAKILPRPGAWMERFKQFLAWPLFASAAWLVTVLVAIVGIERATPALFGLVMLGFLIWLFGALKFNGLRKAIFVLSAALLLSWFYPNPKLSVTANAIVHVAYSKSELARLRAAGTPVFLDVTATWCITCQSNKKLVLHTAEVTNELRAKKAIWMEADWTEPDEEISALLTEFGRAGIPLNVYFAPHAEPFVFAPLLTTSMVLEAIAK